MENYSQQMLRDSKGAIVPMLAVALITLIAAAALSVDQGKNLMTHREAENLADSLALSSVVGLDGTIEGLDRSTQFFAEAMSEGTLVHIGDFSGASSHSSASNSFTSSNVTIAKEVGFYGYTNGHSQPGVFTSFTNLGVETASTPETFHVPGYFIANAVRVTVQVRDITNPFYDTLQGMLGIGGQNSSSEVLGSAIALRDQNIELPVAPIAIPVCELFQNHNPYDNRRYSEGGQTGLSGDISVNNDATPASAGGGSPYFENLITFRNQVESQCAREIVAREPEPNDRAYDTLNAMERARLDGIIRSDSYHRPPLAVYNGSENECYLPNTEGANITGWQPNCKASPIQAILGVPQGVSFPSHGPAGTDELRNSILLRAQSGSNGTRAKIGTPFRPIEDSGYLQGGLSDILRNAINSGLSTRHGPEFNTTGHTIGSEFFNANGLPELNFPFRRNLWVGSGDFLDPWGEMRIPFVGIDPFFGTGDDMNLSILMASSNDHREAIVPEAFMPPHTITGNNADQETSNLAANTANHLRYTNPMCHTQGVGDGRFDTTEAPVWPAYAMLVAGDSSYCDFSSTTDAAAANRQLPTAATNPIVVGFVKISIFDFRFDDYQTGQDAQWLEAVDLEAGLEDRNTWALDIFSIMPEFSDILFAQNSVGQDTINANLCGQSCTGLCQNSVTNPTCQSLVTACHDAQGPDGFCNQTADEQSEGDVAQNEINQLVSNIEGGWVEDCFGDTADSLRQLAAQGEEDDTVHCAEVCGGVYIPDDVIDGRPADNFYINLMQTVGYSDYETGSPWQQHLANRHQGANGYSWVGFDHSCMQSMIGNSFQGLGCSREAGENSSPPRGNVSCDDVCLTAYTETTLDWYGLEFNWTTDQSASCLAQCNDTTGVHTGLRNRAAASGETAGFAEILNTLNALDYQQSQGFQYANPNIGADGNDEATVIATYEDLASNHGATQVCFPRHLNNQPIKEAGGWEQPTPRASGSGCSGVRLRMSCEMTSLQFGQPFDQLKPAIVGK